MKTVLVILIVVHGLIHTIGFLRAFGLVQIEELKPASRSVGIAWLIAGALIITFGILYARHAHFAWIAGFGALVISQLLIICFWSDTWFGTFPNLIMLGAIMISYGNFTFDRLVQRETDVILSATTTIAGDTLLEQDIVHLPTCVRRWLRQSNAIGKPVICVGRIEQRALIKLKPEQEEWHQARAVQFTTTEVPAFIWTVDVDVNALVAFRGRDTYIDGKGNMLITLHSLLRIVNETGEKLDEGTLQRYLGEMVWFPSLAVSPYISWDRIDTYSARATMTYRGITGSGTFTFNDQGDFVAFSAMRYKDNTPTAQRYPWVLTVEAYETFEGRRIPSALQATWQLEDGDWTWLKLHLTKVSYNENALQYREQ